MADRYDDDEPVGTGAEAFLRLALKRFKIAEAAEASLRAKMLDDKKFFAGEHWNAREKADREAQELPCLAIDRLKQPKRQITNALMGTRPGGKVNAVDSYSDAEKAEALQGLVQNIERQSRADVVYATGLDNAVICGRGYWRVDTPWVDGDPDPNDPDGFFRREIKLLRIRNPFTIYVDPTCQEIDYRDARFYFVIEDVPIEEYRERYPQSEACRDHAFAGIGNDLPDWHTEKIIRIAEYWHTERKKVTQALIEVPTVLEDGTPGPPKRIVMEKPQGATWPAGVTEVDTRPHMKRQVKWACINAIEVLEGNERKTAGRDWAGKYIPIIPCLGEEIDVAGKVDLRGIVRDAKDAQRVYDYQVTDLIEKQMMASKAPWVMAEGQDEGYEDMWAVANRKRFAYLKYKPTSFNGQLVVAPFRNNFEPAIQATSVGIQQSEHWIMSSTGFHEPSLGQQGPQESGVAIRERKGQAEIGSSHYAISFAHAIGFTTEIVIDLIPHTYDAARIERIIGPDDSERTVLFYNGQMPGDVESLKRRGIVDLYDISTGKYDVVATAAPSKDTQRQEETEMLQTALQAAPQLMPVLGDLYFERLGTPVGRKMSERMKKSMPEHLRDEQDGPDPAQLQAQVQQLTQQLEQGMQAYQQLQQVIQTKQVETQGKAQAEIQTTQAELSTKERLAHLEAETRVKIAEIQANAKLMELEGKLAGEAALARLDAALDEIGKRLDYERTERVAARSDARDDSKEVRTAAREDERFDREREAATE